MTTAYNGTRYAQSVSTPVDKIDPGYLNCKVKYIEEKFVYAVALVAGDTVQGPKIPEGAVITKAFVKATTGSGAGVFSLGNAAGDNGTETLDADAFVVSADCSGGAVLQENIVASAKINYKMLEAAPLLLTVVTGTTATSGTIYFGLWYTLEF